jgi:hypothetical protein
MVFLPIKSGANPTPRTFLSKMPGVYGDDILWCFQLFSLPKEFMSFEIADEFKACFYWFAGFFLFVATLEMSLSPLNSAKWFHTQESVSRLSC